MALDELLCIDILILLVLLFLAKVFEPGPECLDIVCCLQHNFLQEILLIYMLQTLSHSCFNIATRHT